MIDVVIPAYRGLSETRRCLESVLASRVAAAHEVTVIDRQRGVRRGRVVGSESEDGMQLIVAEVPTAEIARYAMDLRAVTAGRGTYTVEHHHYAPVPDHLSGKVLADLKA